MIPAEEDSGYFQKADFNFNDTFDHFETIYSGVQSHTIIFSAIKGFKRFTIKGLKPEYQEDPFFIAQLRKEFEIGYLLDHPNIARYYSFEVIDGKGHCIIREWIDGNSLDKYFEKSNPSAVKIIELLNEICDGLRYLQRHQIVHGDLKPSNILITNEGEHPKIIDLGFSDSPSYANMKIKGGTMDFASPEQKGEIDNKIGYKSDLYSLGKIIERLNFKKPLKLKRITRKLTAKNPMERPELKEIQEILKQEEESNRKNFGDWWLAAIVLVISSLFLWYSNQQKMSEESGMEKMSEPLTSSTPEGSNQNFDREQKNIEIEIEKPDQERIINKKEKVQERNKGNSEQVESILPINVPEVKENKEIRTDVHPLEIITYNETLRVARKYYSLYPDSIKDWKNITVQEVRSWLFSQISGDTVLEDKCLEAIEKGVNQFESTILNKSSN